MVVDVQKSEIVAALAGNRAADVAQSGPNSPKRILETIWDHMAKLSLSTSDPTLFKKELLDFAAYYTELNSTLVRRHFKGQCAKYEELWEKYKSWDVDLRELSGNSYLNDQEYLEMNREIYLSTRRFCSALAAGVPVSRNDLQDYFDTVSVLFQEIPRRHGHRPP